MVPSTPSASPALPPLFTPKLKLNLWTPTRITSATRVSWQNGVATSIHIRFPAEGFPQSFPLWASPVGGEALFLFRAAGPSRSHAQFLRNIPRITYLLSRHLFRC